MRIGFTELIIVFIVALFVIGPDQLPEFARKLGEGFAAFRKYSNEATKDIKESIVEPLEEAQRPLREAMAPVEELRQEVEDNIKEVKSSITGIGKPKKDGASGAVVSRQQKDEKQDDPVETDVKPDMQPQAVLSRQEPAETEPFIESGAAGESEDVAGAMECSENSRNEREDVI
ncbi:MAG: twin-arginine translocase TatA/TatE family subunit [Clostridiales bacterium]|nr:twin-arginine translocase TatA/TatE family subunit [Clostridiales bacterium]